MTGNNKIIRSIFLVAMIALAPGATAQDADDILRKVDENMSSDNRIFESTMTIHGKRNSRTVDDPEPVPAARRWLEDRFLANTVFGRLVRFGELAPPLVPSLNRLAVAAWGTRRFSDASHRVFVSPVEPAPAPMPG